MYSYSLHTNLTDCDYGLDRRICSSCSKVAAQISNLRWESHLHSLLGKLNTKQVVITTNPADADVYHVPVCFANWYFHHRTECTADAIKAMSIRQEQIIAAMHSVGNYWDNKPHVVTALKCNIPPGGLQV
jgi:hypothetical protein